MDAPTPIHMYSKIVKTNDPDELNNNISQSKIINKKEYELKHENNIYNLQIQIDSNYIYFKIIENKDDDIVPTFYKNKFDLKTITSILKLYPDIYNDLNKIISLINDCYNTNKIKLSIEENNVKIIITIINGNIEIECPIKLIETKTGIDDKFEIIINDIKLLKKNVKNSGSTKIVEIEKTIKDMQVLINKKFEENDNKIKELSSKFEKSEKNVKLLQDELYEIKKYLKESNKSNLIHIDNNNKIEKMENKDNINIDDMSNNLEINSFIRNQNDQQNSDNKNELYINYNNEKEIIINKSFDNDIKDGYKTPNIKINIPKKYMKTQTMETLSNRISYNSFAVTPQNEKEKSNKNVIIEKNDNENDYNRNNSYYSEKPNNSDDSSDDSSNLGNKSLVLFKSDKWKMKHSKRKLRCITEDINAPLPPVISIPKIKIFRGFKRCYQISYSDK